MLPGHRALEGLPARPPGAALTRAEPGQSRDQKPKVLPCKYCNKRFRRVEHVQRHERTHTKEKPFSCDWDRCGKTFGRRDLLVRHEKLVHLNEGSKDNRQTHTKMLHGLMLRLLRPNPLYNRNSNIHNGFKHNSSTNINRNYNNLRCTPRPVACNLDVLSDAAALATEVNPMQPMVSEMADHPAHSQDKVYGEPMEGYPPQPLYDDYNLFLDDLAASPHLIPPHFEPDEQLATWARSPARPPSQFPSRFASVAPDIREPGDSLYRPHDEFSRAPSFRISALDHGSIRSRMEEYSAVLPSDFVFPSRHTLTRFFEGYVTGFHEQLPFLHLPTLAPAELGPELLLAILAVGAQYRFESNRGYALWYAAKAVAAEQIRRRHSSEVHALLPTAAAYSPHSTRPSPSTSYRHSFASAQSERPTTQDTHREPYSPNNPQARLETIQAALILFASTLSMLIRQEGLHVEASQAMLTDWDSWVRLEGANRTKLLAYCFFNLCSTAYDMPPLLMTSELNLYLPLRARLWRAETAWQWQELRQSTPVAEITVHDAVSRLFDRANQGLPAHLSSLGYYILIHTLIQHVYLLKQTSFAAGPPFGTRQILKPEDAEDVTQALRVWQTSFEHRRHGSLTFNATALLRLVYIRLYADMAPKRSLETRDSTLIASALSATPPLLRGPRLHRAVFQAVHALSMLVKAGVNYVARAKSTEWGIQLSLCNFECAMLLAKWLIALSAIRPPDPPASPEEKGVLEMVRRLLDETEFAVPMDMATSDGAKLRQLASAVVRLWAETFKGTHIFDLIKVMGASLDGYADLVDRPPDRGSVSKMASEAGMG
ncbi:fungal specific transcription factor domain-containing protein [Hirsutella rhossiliensis]|uniref:Fungal specific transcription factor domain-containing protein n=1 Tax=Hirsutella rhossiliensis TaxID=111463 RepID=A0A9P8SHL1_9HYPO|nr:fungal specific transcription factor domain-containing protein [Hirsutella rhossiliensis]KAH0961655.1 fungal specific transcription factor domain-containing protein [Hirsutella rhossiliensis]